MIAIALAVSIAPALLVLQPGHAPLRSSSSAFVPHSPIIIDGNAEFHAMAALEGWPGSGTLASPYIISGYEFAGRLAPVEFSVASSTVYFVLRDCYFHDCENAVYLYLSSNAKVENCTIERASMGILPYMSSVTFANNTIRECNYASLDFINTGVLYSNNIVTGNVNGIYMLGGDGDVITGNTFQNNHNGGLTLGSSTHLLLRNNIFLKDGLSIVSNSVNEWESHDIDTSNTVNGQPILYLVGDVGGSISTDYGQLIMANCTNTVVNSQDLENTTAGVLAGFCSGISVRTSTLRDSLFGMKTSYCDNSSLMSTHTRNNSVGIQFEDSDFCYAAGVTFEGDQIGVQIRFSPNTTVIGNIISTDEIGILIEYATGARILANTMTGCGILIDGDLLEHWNTHEMSSDNMVNGYPVVYLKNVIGEPVPSFAGQVILANCAQMQVAFSYIDRATAGFQLAFTSGCRVTTLSVSNCLWGVRLFFSPGNTVDNAILNDDTVGVYVAASDMCTVTTNSITNCTTAILLQESRSQTVSFNTMKNCGIVIDGNMLDGWNTHTIDISNFVNSKAVYYRKDTSALTVLSGYGQVILANCTSSVVGPQTITNATIALQLGYCTDITVNNLTASGNVYGIRLEGSNSCGIKGPWLTYNEYGLYINDGSFNAITNGLFYMSESYGIYLGPTSSENMMVGNTLQYNNGAGDVYNSMHVQAYDAGSMNVWNSTVGGNFWQDWQTPDGDGDGIVDVPYKIEGYGGGNDYLPLTTPTRIIPEFGLIGMVASMAVTVVAIALMRRREAASE